MAPPALGAEIFSRGFRFLPTPEEAVTYYLPRLVAGKPLHGAVRPFVHRADVHACAPADLARRFRPLPRTGDRFFFTPSSASRNKRARGGAAGGRAGGSWHAQSTVDIMGRRGDDDAKVGELRKLRYKKQSGGGGVYTDWLMDEYSCCSVAGAGDGKCQLVLCKMYVSPRAAPTSAARQESAAYYFFRLPPPAAAAVVMQMKMHMQPAAPAAAHKTKKRLAAAPPPLPAMSPPCAKRMRRGPVLLLQPAGGNVSLPPPPPPQPSSCVVLPTRSPLASTPLAPPPQPSCAGSTTRLATQASPASAPPPLAPPVPVPIRPAMRPPMPLPAPQQQQVPLPTPPVVRACQVPVAVQSKQRRILVDPFEAAMQAQEQTVPAAPHPPPPLPAAATPALQDGDGDEDDWDHLDKALAFGD